MPNIKINSVDVNTEDFSEEQKTTYNSLQDLLKRISNAEREVSALELYSNALKSEIGAQLKALKIHQQ